VLQRVASIGSLLKKVYRLYSGSLLLDLKQRGFPDLRPSFLEILLFICEHDGPLIRDIGRACGLKKQTMTGHLNELEKRGYISRKPSIIDKRGQEVFLTEYGEKFRLNLYESMEELEKEYSNLIGSLEIERLELALEGFHSKILAL
jgi:DNA-binding MarR family transcriptional regulator